MTGDEYVEAMEHVSLACRLLLNLDSDLDDCLRLVEKGETIGPVLDPTGFATGGARNLANARRVLEAAITLGDVSRNTAPELLTKEPPRVTGPTGP